MLVVAGFHRRHFFIIDVNTRKELFSTETGGAHRFWKLRFFSDNSFVFCFIRLGQVYSARKGDIYQGNSRIIKNALHSDTIRAIAHLDKDVFVTGAEDGHLKVIMISKDQLSVLETINTQQSDVKCIGKRGDIVVSAGSNGQVKLWRINNPTTWLTPIELSDQLILSAGVRVMDIAVIADDIIAAAYSDSFIRLFRINKKPVGLAVHKGHCVLKLHVVTQSDDSLFIISTGTDGILAICRYENDLLMPLDRYQLHQSGINAMAIRENLVLTGGDDGAVIISQLSSPNAIREELSINILASYQEAHHSTVTGFVWLDRSRFVSASVDQRLFLWEYVDYEHSPQLIRMAHIVTQVADISSLSIHNNDTLIIVGSGLECIPLSQLLS